VNRAIGFGPSEISAIVNRDVVSQHAEEAAFLWTTRTKAIGEPHYSLQDLVRVDERVEAHLDGLRVAGDVGWDLCRANLANDGPGEVFALTVLAFGAGNRERMRDALYAGWFQRWAGLIMRPFRIGFGCCCTRSCRCTAPWVSAHARSTAKILKRH